MRIERRHLGDRVRVILNRLEAKRAAATFLPADAGLVAALRDTRKFEHACRIVAAEKIDVPLHSRFTVGLDSGGEPNGATFEWFETTLGGPTASA